LQGKLAGRMDSPMDMEGEERFITGVVAATALKKVAVAVAATAAATAAVAAATAAAVAVAVVATGEAAAGEEVSVDSAAAGEGVHASGGRVSRVAKGTAQQSLSRDILRHGEALPPVAAAVAVVWPMRRQLGALGS